MVTKLLSIRLANLINVTLYYRDTIKCFSLSSL